MAKLWPVRQEVFDVRATSQSGHGTWGTFVFKCVHNIAPDLFRDNFMKSSHNYSIRRNGLDLLLPKVHTETAKKGCFYSGALAFNGLPSYLKEIWSVVP